MYYCIEYQRSGGSRVALQSRSGRIFGVALQLALRLAFRSCAPAGVPTTGARAPAALRPTVFYEAMVKNMKKKPLPRITEAPYKSLQNLGFCTIIQTNLLISPFLRNQLHLYCSAIGARAPASAPAIFGVAIQLALQVNFRSCAPTALRPLGAPLRSGAPRSAALQCSD